MMCQGVVYAQVTQRRYEVIHAPLRDGYSSAVRVAVSDDGIVYVATVQGVAKFDRERWTSAEHPEGTRCEAIATGSKGKVFAGFTNDFGEIRSTPVGLEFKSAMSQLGTLEKSLGQCRSILILEHQVYVAFRFGLVIGQAETEGYAYALHSFGPGQSCTSMSVVRGEVIMAMEKGALHRVTETHLEPMADSSELDSLQAYVNGCCELGDDEILVSTYGKGMSVLRDGRYQPFDTEIGKLTKGLAVRGITRIDSERYALSSQTGVTIFDQAGDVIEQIELEACRGPAVLDSEMCLWFPLQRRGPIARVDMSSRVRTLQLPKGEIRWRSTLADRQYCAIDNLVYQLKTSTFTSFEDAIEPLTTEHLNSIHCLKTGKALLLPTVQGLHVIQPDGTLEKVHDLYFSDGVVLQDGKTAVLGSYYQGISVLRSESDRWEFVGAVNGAPTAIESLCLDEEARWLWMSAENENGRYRPCRMPAECLNDLNDSDTPVEWFDTIGIRRAHGQMCKWNSRVLVNSRDFITAYDPTSGQLAPLADLLHDAPEELRVPVERMAVDSIGNLWLSTVSGSVLRVTANMRIDSPVTLGENRFLQRFLFDADNLWLVLDNNEVIVLPTDLPMAPGTERILLKAFQRDASVTETVRGNSTASFTVPFGISPLVFKYSSPSSRLADGPSYQYRLIGDSEHWSDWTDESEQNFRSLASGDYRFEVRARGA
ncbi:MAG: triple tyrosine motif-containing protein, partial [Pirellulaceae bacterium]